MQLLSDQHHYEAKEEKYVKRRKIQHKNSKIKNNIKQVLLSLSYELI